MADGSLHLLLRQLHRKRGLAEAGGLSDGQLLERFVRDRDEAAFEVLVWRHGSAVLGVSQRVLRREADAEDVFQATFLTLARKAGSVRRPEALAGYLYRVAYRLAVRLRATLARRLRAERAGAGVVAVAEAGADGELLAALDGEVHDLPEKYRAAVVLCYLEGLTTDEAGRVLGCPRGTVLSRLAWARQRLRNRLVRRGLAPAAAVVALESASGGIVPPSRELVASVVRAAPPFAAGGAAGGVVSSQVIALTQGALQSMFLAKLKILVAIVVVVGVAGTGASWWALGAGGSRSAVAAAPQSAKPGRGKRRVAEEEEEAGRIKREKARAEESAKAERAAEQVERLERIVKAREELAKLRAVEEDDETDRNRKMIETLEGFAEAEERLRQAEREPPPQAPLEVRLLEAEAKQLIPVVVELRVKQLTAKPEELKRMGEQLKVCEERLKNVQERIRDFGVVAGRSKTAQSLIALRKNKVVAEESVRQLERRQAIQRADLAARREAAAERLRQLEGLAPAEPGGRDFRKLERKLDALQRELTELRREVRRLRPGGEK